MKNILNIDNGIPTLLSNVDDGTNTLYINDELVPSSEWTGTGYYTFTSGGLTFTIRKIRDNSGNIMLQLIEQSGGTSYRLIKAISNDEKYYSIEDPAETDLADGDYMPFYDTSAGRKKKTLWSNIVDKLKAIFLTNFVGTTARWNALSREQKAQYKTTDFKDDSTPSPIDANPTQGSGNAVASGGVYSALVKVRAFTYLGDAQTPKTANTAVTINLSESMDNYVLLYIRYGFGWGWNHPLIVSPSAFGVPCISTCEGQGRIRIDRVSATAIKITTESYDLGHANNDDRTAVWGIIKK